MIGYYGIKEHQEIADYYNAKESMAYVQLNYNFVHVVLKKQWARPKLVAGKLQVLSDNSLRRNMKDQQRTGRKGEERKDDS